MKKLDSLMLGWALVGSLVVVPGAALAQGQPPATTPTAVTPAPAAPAPVTPPPADTATPVATAPTVAEPAPEPMAEPLPVAETTTEVAPVAAEAAAEEEEAPATFPVTVGAGFRMGLRLQDPTDPEGFGDIGADELNVEPRFSGRVTDIVGWTANLTVSGRSIDAGGLGPLAFEAKALDLVGQLDFHDWFHVWMGRLLTPSDRSNFSGPWFMSPWQYSGVFYAAAPGAGYVGPRGTEELGREVGTVIWGHDPDGKFKYYAGVMDLDSNLGNTNAADVSPLYAARVQYAIIGAEKGFYSSSTYYGAQDIVSIGAAFRSQAALLVDDPATGMVDESDDSGTTEFNADVLAEFNPQGVGTLTAEAAFYSFDSDFMPMDSLFYGVLSYTTEDMIGIGKLQPVARFQTASNSDSDVTQTQIDVGVNYVMKDYFAKLALTFTTSTATNAAQADPTDEDSPFTEDAKANLIQLGFQIQQ